MVRKMMTAAVLAASVATAMVPVAASARDHDRYNGYGYQDSRYDRDYGRRHGDRRYQSQGYYGQSYSRGGYDRRYYGRGNDRRYYGRDCHKDGTTGAVLGAIAGGLIGNGVAGRGDRTLGTVLGGGAGLFAGRAIERSGNRC